MLYKVLGGRTDLVLSTEGLNERNVGGFSARLNEDSQVRLATVQSLRAFTQAPGKAIVHQSALKHVLEGFLNGHGTLGGGS